MGYTTIKHGGDKIAAGILLLVLSPIVGGILILLRMVTRESPIFTQARVGCRERVFMLYKIKTMYSAELFAKIPLLSAFCRVLRKYSVDEALQLWNVLKGDMSLIGPRPLLVEYLPLYNQNQRKRHQVRPGITGWAQVHGRNALDWPQRFELDIWYVTHKSLRLDIKIFIRTLMHLLHPKGVRPEGLSDHEKFQGNPINLPHSADVVPSSE